MASPLQDFLDVRNENDYQDRMASEDALLTHAVENLDTSKPVNAIMQDLYKNYGKNDSTLISALLKKPLNDVSPLDEVADVQHASLFNTQMDYWPEDAKYPPDIMAYVEQQGVNPSGSSKYFVPGMAKWGLKKAAPKIAARMAGYGVPGLGWGVAAADFVDYFGFPIYDYIPGGDYLTWRNKEE